MNKEHNGGSPDYGLDIGRREESFAVIIQHPVFAPASFRDELADRRRAGEDIEVWVAGIIRDAIGQATHETVRRLVALLVDSRKPRLRLHQLLWAFGFNAMMQGANASKLAKRNGISKQAFQQGVERIKELFGLNETQSMRDKSARATMSGRGFRKSNISTADNDYYGYSQ